MHPHQQQQVITTGVVQPYVVHRTPGPFNDKQAAVVGMILISIGCLSILFNTIDLSIGTGMPRYNISSITHHTKHTLSHASLGVAGHGFWSGALVSIGYVGAQSTLGGGRHICPKICMKN